MAVKQRGARCWVIKEVQESPLDRIWPEPDWHFDTLQEAQDMIATKEIFGSISQEEVPCWLAKCDTCDEVLGNDEFDEVHYSSESEAQGEAECQDDHCLEDSA